MVAPRALLTTEALGDLWSNPSGTWQTHAAAKDVFRFVGAEKNIGIAFREGGHEHNSTDWRVLLDFADIHFRGREPKNHFAQNPFADLKPCFSWRAPT